MPQTVLILGAGYAGIGIAHKLLKDTLPKLPDLKVILVSPTSHHLWNLAVVRGIVPGQLPDEAMFHAIEPGFNKYPAECFEFVLGAATSVDTSSNTVRVKTSEGPIDLSYTQLVIATGSSYASRVPFTTIGTYRETLDSLHAWQAKVMSAESIVIAGAGPTGVETAAELASTYGLAKTITLLVPSYNPLSGLLPEVGKTAGSELEKLGVKILRRSRVTSVEYAGEQYTVKLSSGVAVVADLYLPLFGMKPNSGFLPPALLDEQGNLKLDRNLRATGLANVWGAGDVGDLETKQLIYAERQALHLARNLDAHLTGAEAHVLDLKPAIVPQIFVTLGKKKGTGQFERFRVPGFIVSAVKGRTLFTEKAQGLIAGKNIVRSSV
ncbi:hypothetical protein ACJ41O_007251 [Fusarium nematophilum]